MKVKSIRIELDPEETEKNHATLIEFNNGMWTADGPMYPRIIGALQVIHDMLRGRKEPKY
jgi:hypothetical protein